LYLKIGEGGGRGKRRRGAARYECIETYIVHEVLVPVEAPVDLKMKGRGLRALDWEKLDDNDEIYLINYNMAEGYKIYLHTNRDQPERH
jgi:hypothetical protein